MQVKMFSIRDTKLSVYRRPFFFQHEIEALRAFIEVIRDGNTEVSRFPEDYDLYHIGDYDEVTGLVTTTGHHKFIASAKQIVSQELLKRAKDLAEAQLKNQSLEQDKENGAPEHLGN